jgi:glutamate N-acetyltransferase / amino-acid N-acetyltransferase
VPVQTAKKPVALAAQPLQVNSATASCPLGFRAGGVAAHIKKTGAPDLALIDCPDGAAAAAMFTRNLVVAAPVTLSRSHVKSSGGRMRAVLINSGCANAATGADGMASARRCVRALASALKCTDDQLLINSTGTIGLPLPDDKLIGALRNLAADCAEDGLPRAARAIMTTDTKPKMAEVVIQHEGRTCRVSGIAKGSGMIHPNMATMLAVVLTDAATEPQPLDAMLRQAVERSFHRISVDGDTSTNDSVFALASGKAGAFPRERVQEALTAVCRDLALQVVRDGEGGRKLIHVRVHEARNEAEALQVAQTVAGSLLVRTAVTGGDPNWGRILAAVGRSGVAINPDTIHFEAAAPGLAAQPMFRDGAPADTPLEQVRAIFSADTVEFDIFLRSGDASEEFFTCDLTEGYVRINSAYMT